MSYAKCTGYDKDNSSFIRAFTHVGLVVSYRCFGTDYRLHLQGSMIASHLRMGRISCPEKPVNNYQLTLCESEKTEKLV
jgi:hypothetical protein